MLSVPHRARTEVVHELRRLLARDASPAAGHPLPFDLPALDAHLPQGGLSCALHEVTPAAPGDMPAAFGFIAAILSRILPRMLQRAPVLLVTSSRGLAGHGRPHGHGLNAFGLDPSRIILVETTDDMQALWAMEEALRSAAPAVVAGAVRKLDFRASQRLQLAAEESGRPLLLLRPPGAPSVAVTRWRVAATRAALDRFGLIARWRWHVELERCRNGRPGQWRMEFDHATHRFSLAATLADPALPRGADKQSIARAG